MIFFKATTLCNFDFLYQSHNKILASKNLLAVFQGDIENTSTVFNGSIFLKLAFCERALIKKI